MTVLRAEGNLHRMTPSTPRPQPEPNSTPALAPFLVFEGLDGSGKSTLIRHLTRELTTRGLKHVLTREPGGTILAEEIRQLLLRTNAEVPVAETELLLYAASRAQHVAHVIRPALERGEWVLCDRFTASSVAFQCFARGLPRASVDWLNNFAIDKTVPNLNVLLDLAVAESRQRQLHRPAESDRMEREREEFHQAVREGYLAQARENPQSWLVLDAQKSPEALSEQLTKELAVRKWLA